MAQIRLWHLHLGRHVRGMVRGPVKDSAVLPDAPDTDSTRECLPHFYRAAFERARRGGWSRVQRDSIVSLALYSSRGHQLNTLYAIPAIKES